MTTPATPAPLPAEVPLPAEAAVPGRAVMLVRQHLINEGCTIPVQVIRDALEAAAPHLAAAERERCAQLAQGEAAKYRAVGEDWANLGAGALEDFAALLREQP